MKLAIIGATGNVGQRLVKEATSRGHQVTAISHNAEKLKDLDGVATVQCELGDEAKLAEALKGADAVILSVRFQDNDIKPAFEATRKAGVSRIAVVGGAASLFNADGVRLIDQPGFPDFIKVEAGPAAASLDWIKAEVKDLDWVFISPSMMLGPGERTGKFRLGKDHLLVAEDGNSSISYEDLAVALIDELEKPAHHRERFTAGY
ncbi:MAG: NAD(P)-dependent oxidoreductase [Caulobacteraceae bacterium]